jgi:hypothetical protein
VQRGHGREHWHAAFHKHQLHKVGVSPARCKVQSARNLLFDVQQDAVAVGVHSHLYCCCASCMSRSCCR